MDGNDDVAQVQCQEEALATHQAGHLNYGFSSLDGAIWFQYNDGVVVVVVVVGVVATSLYRIREEEGDGSSGPSGKGGFGEVSDCSTAAGVPAGSSGRRR